jgi:outer membrane protein assembly factor BamB
MASWSQWGGPNQNFKAQAGDLATSWPEEGPRKLWSRSLGEGYSAILFEGDRLYTMYRPGDKEAIVCLDAKTGETIWEYAYEFSSRKLHESYGRGPRSTPLIAGDRLFAIGVAGKMHALNKRDGKVLWTHELWGEGFGGNVRGHGYSSSPVAYNDTVIVPAGGENASLVAFDQESGDVRWSALSFKNSHSSPRIVKVAGEQQLVVFMAEELIGVNPDNGELRWRYPHANQWGHNISMPTIVGGDTIVLSSVQAGARGLRLSHDGEAIKVEEIWSTRKIQFYHASTVRSGDWVYGSTGTMATSFMTGVNIRTGEVAWRERGIARANCVAADGKLVILDEDGMLYLASVTPEKLVIHSKTQLLNRVAWTVPTIVGATMYVRDTRQIIAVDLG